MDAKRCFVMSVKRRNAAIAMNFFVRCVKRKEEQEHANVGAGPVTVDCLEDENQPGHTVNAVI